MEGGGERVCDGGEPEKESSESQKSSNALAGATEAVSPAKDDASCGDGAPLLSPDRSVDSEMQCSSVPSETSRTCSVSQMDTDETASNLNELSPKNGGGSGLEQKGVVSRNDNETEKHSAADTLSSKVVGNLNEDLIRTGAGEGGDSQRRSSQEELVLPSMGILPDAEEKASKSSLPVTDTSPCSNKKESEKPKPETVPTDPSNVMHKIKKIKWQDIEVPIITQNNNGPCPLLAIVNVMLLKGQITLPSDRSEITGGELVLVVGNALFDQPRNALPSEMRGHLEQNTEDAISILHKLLTGLDVNIKFSGVRDFEFTGELCVFDLLGIMLYHGWVVDPTSEVAGTIQSLSYNQLTNNIFAWREEAVKNNNNDLLVKAMLCEEFMSNSGSQLTIHGLFELSSALAKEEIAVLFRNNHFSTIYKRGDQLYQLLTDQGFLHENLVWETLNDVDATFSEFVNGNFEPVAPASPQGAITSSEEGQEMTMQQQINSDQQLAAMLQHEVDMQQQQQQSFERLKDTLGLHNMSDEEIAQKLQEEENRLAAEAEAEAVSHPRQTVSSSSSQATYPSSRNFNNAPEEKKKKECVIL